MTGGNGIANKNLESISTDILSETTVSGQIGRVDSKAIIRALVGTSLYSDPVREKPFIRAWCLPTGVDNVVFNDRHNKLRGKGGPTTKNACFL